MGCSCVGILEEGSENVFDRPRCNLFLPRRVCKPYSTLLCIPSYRGPGPVLTTRASHGARQAPRDAMHARSYAWLTAKRRHERGHTAIFLSSPIHFALALRRTLERFSCAWVGDSFLNACSQNLYFTCVLQLYRSLGCTVARRRPCPRCYCT